MNSFFEKIMSATLLTTAFLSNPLSGQEATFLNEFESISLSDLDFISKAKESVVVATKKINIDAFPKAYNPSIALTEHGILLLFRTHPDLHKMPFVSDTGAVFLDESLAPISAPELLITRTHGDPTPQQSEDIRIFKSNGELYLIYNDNIEVINPSEWDRRDIFMAKLSYDNEHFTVDKPLKLTHPDYYGKYLWQKNWAPFDWQGNILLGYSINPHEIIIPNLATGVCSTLYKTQAEINWHWGKLRGGAPAQLIDGQYLAFFHSPIRIASETTHGDHLMHYFMGAYTFNAEPPFNLTKISPYPISSNGFYTESSMGIRCIYPGGFIAIGPYIYVAYGKDDREIWIAVIDKDKLYKSLIPLNATGE